MKKILLLLTVMFCFCQFSSAQDAVSVMNMYKKEAKAEYMKLPKFLLKIAIKSGIKESPEDEKALRSIKSMEVLLLEDCSKDVKKRFAASINGLLSKGYQKVFDSNKEGAKGQCLVKQSNGFITEMLVLIGEDNKEGDNSNMMRIECNMKIEDFDGKLPLNSFK